MSTADDDRAALAAARAEWGAERARLRDENAKAHETLRQVREHLVEVKVDLQALADEHVQSTNPAPYTSERALSERLQGCIDSIDPQYARHG